MVGYIAFVLFIILIQFRFFHFAHMFQLNSYAHDTHLRWLKKNYLKKLLLTFPNKDVKKKFGFTWRMRRLYVTFNVLALAVFAASRLDLLYFGLIMIVYFEASPYIMLLCDKINKPVETAVNNYYINDAKRILADMPRLKIVGITGSYGKTSVKHFLTDLLNVKYETVMTPASYNTTLGVVRTIRSDLKPTADVFVCEMGARRRGDIKEICDLVKPDIGILNTIGYEHLDMQGSIENIVATNFELIEGLPQDGIAIINHDNEYITENEGNVRFPNEKVTFGLGMGRDYRAWGVRYTNDGTVFTVDGDDGGGTKESQEFRTDILGEHNVLNITAAIACANRMGIPMADLVPAVKRLKSVPHRLEFKKRGNLSIIDDGYNSNLLGAKSALNVLNGFAGFRVLITPGMVELGEVEAEHNYEFGAHAASVCDLVILIGKEQTKDIHRGLFSENYPLENVIIKNNFMDGFAIVEGLAEKRRVTVLIENDLPDNY
jgi:UDP-N-acetylmuramoyl-tripeptide--D-alanyl-D-alanine ligase